MPLQRRSSRFVPHAPAVTIERSIFTLTRAELDAYPHGIIELDRTGTIVYYNDAEAKLARRDSLQTVGRNFFTDVAPCTAVQGFHGRFVRMLDGVGDCCERFTFVFRFAWGDKEVGITMVRRAETAGEKIYLVIDAIERA